MRISTLLLIFGIFTNTVLSVKSMESHDDEDDSNATWINLKELRPTLSMITNQSKEEEPSLQKELIPTGPEAKQEVITKKSTPIKLLPDHLNALSEDDKNKAAGTTNRNEWIHRLEKIWKDKVNSSSLAFAIWKYLPKDIQQEICSYLKDDLPIIQYIERKILHSTPCSKLIETKNFPKDILIHDENIIVTEFNPPFFGDSKALTYRNSKANIIRIYELKTGKYLKELKGHANSITTIITTDNKIISGDLDGIIKIWDIVSGKCLQTLIGHQNAIISLNIYKDCLVSQSQNEAVIFWDLETGNQTTRTNHHQILTIQNNILISQLNNNICVEGYKDEIVILRGHSETINDAILKDDMLISCANDGTIKIWDLNKETLLKSYKMPSLIQSIKCWNNKLIGVSNLEILYIINLITDKQEQRLDANWARILGNGLTSDKNKVYFSSQIIKIIVHQNKIYQVSDILESNFFKSNNGFIRVWDLEMYMQIKNTLFKELNFLEIDLIKKINTTKINANNLRIKILELLFNKLDKKFGESGLIIVDVLLDRIKMSSLIYAYLTNILYKK